MKKYIQPSIEVITLHVENQLLAISGGGGASLQSDIYDTEVDAGEALKGGRGRAWRDYEGR